MWVVMSTPHYINMPWIVLQIILRRIKQGKNYWKSGSQVIFFTLLHKLPGSWYFYLPILQINVLYLLHACGMPDSQVLYPHFVYVTLEKTSLWLQVKKKNITFSQVSSSLETQGWQGQLGWEKWWWKFSRTGERATGRLLLTNQFHNSFECLSESDWVQKIFLEASIYHAAFVIFLYKRVYLQTGLFAVPVSPFLKLCHCLPQPDRLPLGLLRWSFTYMKLK